MIVPIRVLGSSSQRTRSFASAAAVCIDAAGVVTVPRCAARRIAPTPCERIHCVGKGYRMINEWHESNRVREGDQLECRGDRGDEEEYSYNHNETRQAIWLRCMHACMHASLQSTKGSVDRSARGTRSHGGRDRVVGIL